MMMRDSDRSKNATKNRPKKAKMGAGEQGMEYKLNRGLGGK
jgi:hypothetical protein